MTPKAKPIKTLQNDRITFGGSRIIKALYTTPMSEMKHLGVPKSRRHADRLSFGFHLSTEGSVS